MARNIGIIGGGIIGLFSAYYLTKSGFKVTIIDKGDINDGCSFGNAGMIVPSHFIPLAAPGMISKGIRWMFNSTSPFYVRPNLSADLIKWGYLFYQSANKKKLNTAIPALKELSLFSRGMYQDFANEFSADFGFEKRGLLMLYQTAETEHEEGETAHLANKLGIGARVLNAVQVQELEPDVKVKVRGGVYFPGDAHLTPQDLVKSLLSYLQEKGVELKKDCEVLDFQVENNTVKSLITVDGKLTFDEIILAAGSWSGNMAKKLKLSLPMQAGKGYSFTIQNVEKNIRIPSIFLEARVAVTPMGDSLRFGGTMEITGVDHSIRMNRVKGIVDAIPDYYPEMKVGMPDKGKVWHGLRPCSPDGLPYVGRSKKIHNLVIATGHAMLGVSLAPGTGKIVSDLVAERDPGVDLKGFSPDRFQ